MANSGRRNDEAAVLIEIRCISTTGHIDPRERIQAVGGVRNGAAWKLTQSAAIALIENDEATFFMHAQGHSIAIVVAMNGNGRKYLKAITDPGHPTSLLSLPECRETRSRATASSAESAREPDSESISSTSGMRRWP